MINKADLKSHIIAHGCYTEEENLRIYEQWFAHGPRYLFIAVDKRYGIAKKILCDIGCSYGTNLFYSAQRSYGIEIDEQKVKFASSIGLTVYKRDALYENLTDLAKVETIWCSSVLEHIDSPHIFLRKLQQLLKPKGILALIVPIIPIIPSLKKLPVIGKYVSGYENVDHVNAFIPSTLRYICERAGFKTIEVSPFYPGFLRLFQHIPLANRIMGRCVYIGEKIEG